MLNVNSNFCGYRLPCGYCTMLNRDCPKAYDYSNWQYTTTATSGSINLNDTNCDATCATDKKV